MREIKDLTINEGDNAYKFRLTQLSAISLQKWAFKAGVLLASSGVLDADAENTDNMVYVFIDVGNPGSKRTLEKTQENVLIQNGT